MVRNALLIPVFSMWWSYFDDIHATGLPAGPGRLRWLLTGHLLLQTFLVGIAVGLAKLLPLNFGDAVDGDRVLLGAGPLVGIFCALALVGALYPPDIDSTAAAPAPGHRRDRRRARCGHLAVDWIFVDEAAALLAVCALAHGALASVLRRGTRIEEAPLAGA